MVDLLTRLFPRYLYLRVLYLVNWLLIKQQIKETQVKFEKYVEDG